MNKFEIYKSENNKSLPEQRKEDQQLKFSMINSSLKFNEDHYGRDPNPSIGL